MRLFRFVASCAAVVGCAVLLAGCETTAAGLSPSASAAPGSSETRSHAAAECWMQTERTNRGMDLDKRADLVDRCIERKLNRAG